MAQEAPASSVRPQRAEGNISATISASGGATFLARLREAGGLRFKIPRGPSFQGVIVNTAGGIVGGDAATFSFDIGAGAKAILTTQSAEKIYRSDGMEARVETTLNVAADGEIIWAPQPTILFDGALLSRRIEARLAPQARATLAEAVIFGRLGMGEICASGAFRDDWRIFRGGALVFAECARLAGQIAHSLDSAVVGAGARAFATLVHAAPDAEDRIEELRAILEEAACLWGASAYNGLLVARFCAPIPQDVERALARALKHLIAFDRPRVWQ